MPLLNTERFTADLPEVTSPLIFQSNGDAVSYHEDGILSQQLFGFSEADRKSKMAYISLKGAEILHPLLFDALKMTKSIVNIILNKEKYILKKSALVKDPNGETGLTFFKEVVHDFTPTSVKAQNAFKVIRENPKEAFLKKIIVIAPGVRETGQELKYRTITDVNEKYVNILKTTQRVPSEFSSVDDFNYYSGILQIKVGFLFNAIKGITGTKTGISRQNIQAKRVDFSGRATISLDNNLTLDECGLPIMIAVKIFEPFLIKDLLKSFQKENNTLTTKSIINMLRDVYYNTEHSPYYETIKKTLEGIMDKRLVLLNRSPTLHRYGIMAFKPKLTTRQTITISPFACGPFNADFDGDQMAVYHPLTKESQEEAKKMLPSENIISSSSFDLNYNLSQNFAYFLYYATDKVSNKKPVNIKTVDLEAKRIDFSKKVKVGNAVTTVGRYLVTNAVRTSDPKVAKNFPFISEALNKNKANELLRTVYFKFGKTALLNTLVNFKKLTVKYAVVTDDIIDSIKITKAGYRKIDALKKKLENNPEIWDKIVAVVQKDVEESHPLLADLINSKTTKLNWAKVAQALAAKGFITSFSGGVSLVSHSQLDGMTADELFKDSSNNRQGIIDRALSTRVPGYLSRQLVFALSPVKLSPDVEDCGTRRTLTIEVTANIKNQLVGRFIVLNQKLVEVTPEIANGLVGHKVNLRSPMYCKSPKLCHTCYGKMMKYVTENIGIIAAQAIGERGSQLIMRTFHVDAIVDTARKELKAIEGLVQTEHGYKLKKEGVITIDKADVLKMNDYEVYVTGFYFNDHKHIISCTINLISSLAVVHEGNKILIKVEKGAEAIIVNKSTALRDQITEVVGLVNTSQDKHVKNAVALLRTIHDIYNSLGQVNIIHFEILLSQMLRSSNDLTIPFRLDENYDAKEILVGIKKAITLTDPKLALLFERVSDALMSSITLEYNNELESDLTKYHI